MAFAESNKSNESTREKLEGLSKVVLYLDKTYKEKVQRDQDLLKDDNTEALNFEQLNIKVTQISTSLKDEFCKKSFMES